MQSQRKSDLRLNRASQHVQSGFMFVTGLLLLGSIGCGGSDNSEFVEFSQLPSQPSAPADSGSQAESVPDRSDTPVTPVTAETQSDTRPTESQPAVTEPSVNEPAVAEPSVTQPAVTEPAVAQETPAQDSESSVPDKPVSEQPEPVTDSTSAAAVSAVAVEGAISATEASASQPMPTTAQDGSTPVVTGPLEIKLLIPEKIFRPEKNSTALRVSYDDIDLLKVLNMEPVPVDAVEYFPEWLKSLDGATIRIRGFMYPTFEATGLTGFTLARDNGICCFVRQPKIYDIIAVELAPGVTSDYIEGKPFDVEGTFRIQPESDETDLFRLYRIENARVLR